ncbi:MAG TPA: alpha/beta hydrolase [Alphaproteobacteria bacterium]|nr:alpha/beta hydrolase [Alphaproteobacteria bacterium]
MMTSVLLVLAGLSGGLLIYSHDAARRAEADFPPLGSFVVVDGVRLHYLDSAPGDDERQAIVMVHGASGNLRDFAVSIFDELAQKYRVIAIDRPGHGYSERPSSDSVDAAWVTPEIQARLIHGAMRQIGVEKPVILGHSWGGAVVLAYALAFPADTGGGVVLSGASHPWRSKPAFHNRWPAIPVVGDIFVNTLVTPGFKLLSDAAIQRNFAPNSPPPDYARKIGLPLLARPDNWRANAEDMRNLAGFLAQQKKRYSTIDLPMTIISGDADRSVSPEIHSKRLHEAVPNSRLILLPGVGHAPHHAQSQAVIAAVDSLSQHVAQLSQSGASVAQRTQQGGATVASGNAPAPMP